ncbi:MAG: S8 family serine peptidase [candidate division WOR-3 bacterium]|nr:MAG: S8 family serine peptidase [candidate division WOR-3 bacterium]
MYWLVSVVVMVAVSLGLAAPGGSRPVITDSEGVSYIAGQLIVELTPDMRGRIAVSESDGIALFGVPELDELSRRWRVDDISPLFRHPSPDQAAIELGCDLQFTVQFDQEQDITPVAESYETLSCVDYVCPNAWLPYCEEPDDQRYTNQWHLATIGAPFAWDIAKGDTSVLIAVLDDACEWHHPDIEPNLWINHPEDINHNQRFDTLPPPDGDLDGADQDLNGYIDDVIGWNFTEGTPDPKPPSPVYDHGTHCWGIANAATNNGIGVAGVPWNCRSYGFRCGDERGINISAAMAAIYKIVNEGAWAVSMSFGNYQFYQPMADACSYAWQKGLVLVGGAGNDGTNRIFYPANYEHVISVAASDRSDVHTWWSNYGDWIEITAPGEGILSTVTNHGYAYMEGTSMATPLVAGALAWIKSAWPEYSNAKACSVLYAACEPMDDEYYRNGWLGAGRVSIGNIVLPLYYTDLKLTGWDFDDASGNNNGRPDPGETVDLILTYSNTEGWRDASGVSATLGCSNSWVTIEQDTAVFPDIPAGSSGDCSANPFVITVSDSAPPQMIEFSITVHSDPNPAWPDTTLSTVSGEPRVLLVDDDLGADYEKWYEAALDSNGVLYDGYDVNAGGAPSEDTLSHYPVVIWYTGNDSTTTLTGEEQTALTGYLDAGGKLMISGQNIAQDIAPAGFLSDYLRAELVDTSTGQVFMVGYDGDPITHSRGDTMVAGGGGGQNNGRSLDGVRPVNGGIGCAYYKEYADSTVQAIVRYSGAYKLVYFAVPFEAIAHSSRYTQKWTLMERVLRYFGEQVPGVSESPPVVRGRGPEILSVSPNPFSRTARASFTAPASGRVVLTTYSMDGRVVDEQVQRVVLGQRVSFDLDGARLANGVYLVRLSTPAGVYARKTAVLK